jgi:hypothetical protein
MTSAAIISLRNSIIVVLLSVFIALGGFSLVSAQDKTDFCKGANLTFNDSGSAGNINCATDAEGNAVAGGNIGKLDSLLNTVINIFSAVVGIIAVIMIIYGGFKFITSGGDSTKVTSARNTIIYAVIGLIIVALAQTIARFVLEKTPSG